MANREFVITELRQLSGGTFEELPNKFVWTADTYTAPRGGWQFGLTLRTIREDYPGVSGNPTEQVLGWLFDPFTITGRWDDRYAGEGFAEKTRVAFEQMVQRGNLVRIEFEEVRVVGLITNFLPTYIRKYQIDYSFTLSPHYRDKQDTVSIAPQAIANPDRYAKDNEAAINKAIDIFTNGPKEYMNVNIYNTILSSINTWSDQIKTINSITQARVLAVADPRNSPVNSIARLAQSFTTLQESASAMLEATANMGTSTSLAFDNALNVLAFEVWVRELSFQARVIILNSSIAAEQLRERVDRDAMALYRPHASESLYAISNLFYHTPFLWREISERNNLHHFVMTGEELLIIPSKPN